MLFRFCTLNIENLEMGLRTTMCSLEWVSLSLFFFPPSAFSSQIEVDMAGVPVYSNSSKPGPTHHLPRPLCRKCGSGGLMELVRCRVCCHPFHRFCAGVQESSSSSLCFTCPQCITCSICGLGNNVSYIYYRSNPRQLDPGIFFQDNVSSSLL